MKEILTNDKNTEKNLEILSKLKAYMVSQMEVLKDVSMDKEIVMLDSIKSVCPLFLCGFSRNSFYSMKKIESFSLEAAKRATAQGATAQTTRP